MKKVALVTGGARGIGLGISRALAADGYDLAICGVRDASAVQGQVEELKNLGGDVLYCRCDVSNTQARAALVEEVFRHYGRVNVLVNNAGVAPRTRADILEATEESYEWVMKVNLQGPYFLTQTVANKMVAQKKDDPGYSCCIIFISSISSTITHDTRGEYCISKAGGAMAAQLWAARLGEFDIPVYDIRPGIIYSDMTSGVKEKYDKLISEGLCVTRRWGRSEDVGKAAVMLARGDLPYSTGQVLMVDGGMTIPRL